MATGITQQFTAQEPTLEDYWRAIILFGRNVASYKFALGKSLIELSRGSRDLVTLQDLAEPFSRHLCEHLKTADRQTTSAESRFLDACRRFNRGESKKDELIATTAKLGFANVIDAFHIVGPGEVPRRFFLDERASTGGIRLTDELRRLSERFQFQNLPVEIEARWRLVETSWELNLPRAAVEVSYDATTQRLFVESNRIRRRGISGCREALNGYQKGRCFYCRCDMVAANSHIDHFLPHVLMRERLLVGLDGVWNLVLACSACNSGPGGKSANVPSQRFLSCLYQRGEYLIGSNHPLRETLILQMGGSAAARRAFLEQRWNAARLSLVHEWNPPHEERMTW